MPYNSSKQYLSSTSSYHPHLLIALHVFLTYLPNRVLRMTPQSPLIQPTYPNAQASPFIIPVTIDIIPIDEPEEEAKIKPSFSFPLDLTRSLRYMHGHTARWARHPTTILLQVGLRQFSEFFSVSVFLSVASSMEIERGLFFVCFFCGESWSGSVVRFLSLSLADGSDGQ